MASFENFIVNFLKYQFVLLMIFDEPTNIGKTLFAVFR